ncbi:MAG: methyltransferase domain-containing protein [Woeseiaceae bacterium]|nr:methyltransferase domain-containing protein [Woeseiaceae bacterium]
MSHQTEYHDNMVTMLELIWGRGYMAPGGRGNVARLLDGTEPAGKLILDIGCGIGGPAMDMVRLHGAQVVGVDLEAPLIERAKAEAREAGLHEHCQFLHVQPGGLPFADASFDIVTSSGAVTQTPDKPALFAEVRRVLRPGGHFRCYEWMRSEREYSEDMLYWFKLEELTYDMQTLEQYGALLSAAGFESVATTDASAWYRREVRREYDLIRGKLYGRMVELLGQRDADHFVENWRAGVIVCESGEMRQGYCAGRKSA